MIDRFRFRIAGCGTALPRTKLSNVELAKQLGVETSWIESRCGVETRYKSEGDETTLSLAVEASQKVLQQVPGFVPDMLICSTFTPEYVDIREDRIVLYGSVETGVKTFFIASKRPTPAASSCRQHLRSRCMTAVFRRDRWVGGSR